MKQEQKSRFIAHRLMDGARHVWGHRTRLWEEREHGFKVLLLLGLRTGCLGFCGFTPCW